MPRRFLILANPIAGGGRAARRAEQLVAELRERGMAAELHLTRDAGDATRRVAAMPKDDPPWDGVVAAGGDGTVNDVLHGLLEHGGASHAPLLPMAVLPVGTGNVLASELGLPRKPAQLADLIADISHTRQVAIGTAGEQHFLLFAGIGYDAAMVHRFAQTRTSHAGPGLKRLRWRGPVFHVLRRWRSDQVLVELPDGTKHGPYTEVLVTRVRNYGGAFRLPHFVEIGDGRLHILAFKTRHRLRWIPFVLRGLFGMLRRGKDLDWFPTTSARLLHEGDPAPIQVDGDPAGQTPVDLGVHPRPSVLFCPP